MASALMPSRIRINATTFAYPNLPGNPNSTQPKSALISRFALALGIGLLFGLERGWRMRREPPGGRTAGIRTFAISGILGGVVGSPRIRFALPATVQCLIELELTRELLGPAQR